MGFLAPISYQQHFWLAYNKTPLNKDVELAKVPCLLWQGQVTYDDQCGSDIKITDNHCCGSFSRS